MINLGRPVILSRLGAEQFPALWTQASAHRIVAAVEGARAGGTGARLAVDRVSDGAFIGWCSLNRWNPDYRSAWLGY